MYKKLKFISCILVLSLVFCIKSYATKDLRDGVIVEVPIEAFDEQGNIIDNDWIKYLKTKKPIGVIFFSSHFANKTKGKKIVEEVKKTIGDKVILSADEEGGRVNRINWINTKPAEEISNEYFAIKKKYGKNKAINYVKNQYRLMFKEMRELGLNTTFAPNLDFNKYTYTIDRQSKEYKYYKQCSKYIKLLSISDNQLNEKELKEKREAKLLLGFLEEQKIRKMDVIGTKKERVNATRQLWLQLDENEKEKLRLKFKNMEKYANYLFVVGDRSYGGDAKTITEIAEIFVDTAKEYRINCVMKHALGHGKVDGDTHIGKQHLNISLNEILFQDMEPYKKLKNKVPFIMVSHIIYDNIDDKKPAVNSQIVSDLIKKEIHKDAILIADDISMEGANEDVKSPCDLWIITHKPLQEIKKISKLNILNKEQIEKIFNKFIE